MLPSPSSCQQPGLYVPQARIRSPVCRRCSKTRSTYITSHQNTTSLPRQTDQTRLSRLESHFCRLSQGQHTNLHGLTAAAEPGHMVASNKQYLSSDPSDSSETDSWDEDDRRQLEDLGIKLEEDD